MENYIHMFRFGYTRTFTVMYRVHVHLENVKISFILLMKK